MVIARIEELLLEDGVTHVATDWQISREESFATRELESIQDKVNKSAIIWNDILDPNVKWYARARALLSTGYTIWGNVDIFRPENDDYIDAIEDIPTRISIPQISTNSDQNLHDTTLFTIVANGYDVIGTASHVATTWIIEDIDSNVVHASVYDTNNLSTYVLKNVILSDNSIYRIKAMFHSTTGDISPIGSYLIKTSQTSEITLLTYLDYVEVGDPINLRLYPIEGVTEVTWELVSLYKELNQTVWTNKSRDTDPFNIEMPTVGLLGDNIYILKITTNKKDLGSKNIIFRTKPYEAEEKVELIVPGTEGAEKPPVTEPEPPKEEKPVEKATITVEPTSIEPSSTAVTLNITSTVTKAQDLNLKAVGLENKIKVTFKDYNEFTCKADVIKDETFKDNFADGDKFTIQSGGGSIVSNEITVTNPTPPTTEGGGK